LTSDKIKGLALLELVLEANGVQIEVQVPGFEESCAHLRFKEIDIKAAE
jgi:hypothetical protein